MTCQLAEAEALKLRMMIWDGYAPADQVKAFEAMEAKKGVQVTVDVKAVVANDDFFNAARAKTVEVFTPTHNLLKDDRYNYIKNNLLVPVDLANVPNFKDINPALQAAEYFNEGGKVYAVPFASGPYGLAYNKGKVTTPPDSWNALWDPKYAKQYKIVNDYPEVNLYITGLALGMPIADLGDYTKLDTPVFKAKLRALAQGSAGYWSSVDKAEDLKGLPISTA